eukprot:3055075-Rhodomonas_salina.1
MGYLTVYVLDVGYESQQGRDDCSGIGCGGRCVPQRTGQTGLVQLVPPCCPLAHEGNQRVRRQPNHGRCVGSS